MAMPMLSEDVLMEILSRLPAKSLLRFRSVSKTWCDLIQNSRFISLHHSRSQNNPLVLRSINIPNANQQYDSEILVSFLSNQTPTLVTDETPLSSDMMGGVTLGVEVQIFGPCNGIVCLTDLDNTVLFNPAIREFKAVPLSPFSYPRGLQSLTEAVGFGFDHSANDYKVVKIAQLFHDDEGYPYSFDSYRVEVYNLSTDSWRHVDVSVPFHVQCIPCFEMFFNGAFHFYGCNNGLNSESILAFDMGEEVFRQIGFPDVCSYPDGRYTSLSVLNDSLALILYDPLQLEKSFDIWVMNEYGVKESWTRLCSVGPLVGIDWPLGFWKDAEFLLESRSGQLVSCDFSTREIKEFQVHGIPKSLRVLMYKESLISINRGWWTE